jgi:hypothetical protein
MSRKSFVPVGLVLVFILRATGVLAVPGPLAGKRVLIHLKTGFKQDDNEPCVAFDAAFAALKQGAEVEMFFDAGAVVDLKIWRGKPTTLGYEIPQKLKSILAAAYKTPTAKDFPRTYQDFLHWLHEHGVEVTFNGVMAQLTSLSNGVHDVGQIELIAKPLSLNEILQHRARADIYLVY